MKNTPAAKQPAAKQPAAKQPAVKPLAGSKAAKFSRGQFVGETRSAEGYVIDRGGEYLMRAGFEPSTVPIGANVLDPSREYEGLLDGAGDDLVKRAIGGRYEPVGMDQLWGRSVALLFSAGCHPKCASFVPFLIQFYKNVNEEGGGPKVEVIYISLDNDEEAFENSRRTMPWLSLQYSSPLRDRLMKRYRLKVEPVGLTTTGKAAPEGLLAATFYPPLTLALSPPLVAEAAEICALRCTKFISVD
ncbi:probable nucleoredoxin 1 [Cyclospora cayetanensis]|uniref:protein-disulfide reductase n=1 Tax=Cyclospora cayetanensis TaxID=88456 RepID=A0A6P6S216_9EIME|nr:probable nucleoredoxin 1 [Cyclospora cayetanensis]